MILISNGWDIGVSNNTWSYSNLVNFWYDHLTFSRNNNCDIMKAFINLKTHDQRTSSTCEVHS